jgi:hypothetical protein
MCGCFSTKGNSSNIFASWIFCFITKGGIQKIIQYFSSLKCFELVFTKGKMLIEVCARMLANGSKKNNDITDAIDDMIDYVNDKGDWTIIGWGKGVVNDATLLGVANDTKSIKEMTKVTAEDVTIHVVQFHPTDHSILDPNTTLGKDYDAMRFNLSSLLLKDLLFCRFAKMKSQVSRELVENE